MNTATAIENLNHWGGQFLSLAGTMFWQSSLLGLVILVLDFGLRRHLRASVRYGLWLVLLVKLVTPPSLALPTSPVWWWHPTVPAPALLPAPTVQYPTYTVTEDDVLAPDSLLPLLPETTPPPPTLTRAAVGLLAVGGVSVGLLLWLLLRWRYVVRTGRSADEAPAFAPLLEETRRLGGIQSRVRVKITRDTMSPAVCGLFRPVILLPQSLIEKLSPAQLRAVLLHELMHLRRGDVWVNFAQALLQIVYWWHPLVWLANARIRRLREEAVDDAVVVALREEAEIYAPTLLAVAKFALQRPLASLGLVGILESRSALRQRIERLVNFPAPRQAGLTLASAFGILAFSAVALPMGDAPEPPAQPAATPPDAKGPAWPDPNFDGYRFINLRADFLILDESQLRAQAPTLVDNQAPQEIVPGALNPLLTGLKQAGFRYFNDYAGGVIQPALSGTLQHYLIGGITNESGTITMLSTNVGGRSMMAGCEIQLPATEVGWLPMDLAVHPLQQDGSLRCQLALTVGGQLETAQPAEVEIPDGGALAWATASPAQPGKIQLVLLQYSSSTNVILTVSAPIEMGPAPVNATVPADVTFNPDNPVDLPSPAPSELPLRTVKVFQLSPDTGLIQFRKETGLTAESSAKDYILQISQMFGSSGTGLPATSLWLGDQGLLVMRGTPVELAAAEDVFERLNGYPNGWREHIHVYPNTGTTSPTLPHPAPVDTNLVMRTFRLNTNVVFTTVQKALDDNSPAGPAEFAQGLRKLLARMDLTIKPPGTMFYNNGLGLLFVKASQSDVDAIERVIEALDQSPANTASAAAATDQAIRDGKLLYEMGKLDEAEAKFNENLNLLPGSAVALYYLDLIHQAKARQAAAHPYVAPLVYTGPGRQVITEKLDGIRLDHVAYDNLTLNEVLSNLSAQVQQLAPDKSGVNFLLNPNAEEPGVQETSADPATGLPVATPAAEPMDIGSVRIKLNLSDVRLRDVLDALVLVADHPIKYSVQDFAVVFSIKITGKEPLYTRTFKIDPDTFEQGLAGVGSKSFGGTENNNGTVVPSVNIAPSVSQTGPAGPLGGANPGAQTQSAPAYSPARTGTPPRGRRRKIYMKSLRLPQVNVQNVIYDETRGLVTATGTEADLEHFKRALEAMPPVPARTNNVSLATITGILTNPNFDVAIRALEQRQGVETLSEPVVTATSGRQTQVRASTMVQNIVANPVPDSSQPASGNASPKAAAAAFGRASNFYERAFKMNPTNFFQNLSDFAATTLIGITNDQERAALERTVSAMVDSEKDASQPDGGVNFIQTNHTGMSVFFREFFGCLGINLHPPAALSFNDRFGLLFVKASYADFNQMEKILMATHAFFPPAQLHTKARFIEVTGDITNFPVLTSHWEGSTLTGIMAAEPARKFIHQLENRPGSENLAEPEVTTTSGRQTQMRATETRTVVTNVTWDAQGQNTGNGDTLLSNPPTTNPHVKFLTSEIECGPIFKEVGKVLTDGSTVDLAATASLTEFNGYDTPTNFSAENDPSQLPQIIPDFWSRRFTAHLRLYDNQTLLIYDATTKTNALINPSLTIDPARPFIDHKRTHLLVLATVSIVDDVGNRVHTDEQLPLARDLAPPQGEPALINVDPAY